jgi:hypothetical protein
MRSFRFQAAGTVIGIMSLRMRPPVQRGRRLRRKLTTRAAVSTQTKLPAIKTVLNSNASLAVQMTDPGKSSPSGKSSKRSGKVARFCWCVHSRYVRNHNTPTQTAATAPPYSQTLVITAAGGAEVIRDAGPGRLLPRRPGEDGDLPPEDENRALLVPFEARLRV